MSDKSKRNTLSLAAIEGQLLPDELTYQGKLRAAMSGAVAEADVTEVVKEIVAKAKAGDRNAQKMFFEYLVGVKNAPTKVVINNNYPDVHSAGRNVEEQAREALAQRLSSRRNGHAREGCHADEN